MVYIVTGWGYMFCLGGAEKGLLMQQNLYLTSLGSLVCEHCEAPAAGKGTREAPYVITHAPDCQFTREAARRLPGRHRAPACG